MSLEITNTIRNQIGSRALYMLGAQKLGGHKSGFSFRFRGCQTLNHCKITLNSLDTYDMEFCKIGRAPHFKISNKIEKPGLYADMLHKAIEQATGLYTSL
ncbi:MAG: hypothetical protein JRD89_01560 [Deltaproteobacteria bacterium]|nr:hypothetical protein [Deltaproteobacteria bacterium]